MSYQAEYRAALHNVPTADLEMVDWHIGLKRNVALVAGTIAIGTILLAGWSLWAMLVPALIWFKALKWQIQLMPIWNELKIRNSM